MGALAALCLSCSATPEHRTSGSAAVGTTDAEVAASDATQATDAPEHDGTDEPTVSVDGDAVTTTASTVGASTTGVSQPGATTGGPATTTPTGTATTTTARAGGGATSSTVRATTTTVKPKPTTTITQPPATPAPTPPPTPAPTPAPTSPPRTIGSCQQLSLDTVNTWRAGLGRPPLSSSSSLYNGACSWATHLAETDSLGHAPGVSGEVVALGSGSCSGAFSIWMGSSGHYAVLTSTFPTMGGVACVKDSEGTFWAVGRLA